MLLTDLGFFIWKKWKTKSKNWAKLDITTPNLCLIIIEPWFAVFDLFKGQFSCGNKHCDEKEGLKSWEVNFGYVEHGEKRNALVKLSKSAIQGYVNLKEDKYLVL